MKNITYIILILFFSITVSNANITWPWSKKPQPKPTPESVEIKKEPASLSNARGVVKELNTELLNARAQNAKLKDNLERANSKVAAAEAEIQVVKAAAEKLKEWGIVQQSEKFKFMERYENAVKRYHRLKMIAAIIAAAAGVFLGLQFMHLVPPPYNFGVPVGGALLFAILVWLLL